MKKLQYILLFAFLAIATACSHLPEVEMVTVSYSTDLTIAPEDIQADSLSFHNLTSGEVTKMSSQTIIPVVSGFYNVYYEGVYETPEKKYMLRGSIENVILDASHHHLDFHVLEILQQDDFIFEEIFFTGTLRSSGKQYYGDSYIKIFNNTDHVLYADGIAFVESKFVSTQKYECHPDIRNEFMTIQAIYVVPGNGTDHPVQPGESMLIVDTGINHHPANENSLDLSAADFEWYDVSTKPAHMDIDSETVPNLDKWYCYTLSFFVLHNRGFRSYALARIPIEKEKYLVDYWYTYEYDIISDVGIFPMSQSAYKLPNAWIVDAVNCSVAADWVWNLLPADLDAGWTHCGKADHDKTRYFKSVRRKFMGLGANGRVILKDTNNSTEDFNTECVPSMMEIQNSAIWSDGTKANQLTYDGVVPKPAK